MECDVCRRNKGEQTHIASLLHPISIPERKWESISIDFIIGLLVVQGRDYIYVVVYKLTKFAHFFTVPSKSSAS